MNYEDRATGISQLLGGIFSSKSASADSVPRETLRKWLIGTISVNLFIWMSFGYYVYSTYQQPVVTDEDKSIMKYMLLVVVVIALLSVGLVMHYYCSAIEQTNNPSIRAEYQSVYDYQNKRFTNGFYSVMNQFGSLCWWLLAIAGVILIALGVIGSASRGVF